MDAGGFAAADKEAAERSVSRALALSPEVFFCNARNSFDVVVSN